MVAIQSAPVPHGGIASPEAGWRLERVCFAVSGDPAAAPLSFEFDRGLNVVVVGSDDVAAMVQRLQGALHHGEVGTHVEFATDGAAPQVVFRPSGGRHRLIDVEAGTERALDSLAELHDPSTDSSPSPQVLELVEQLCRLDQRALWTAAEAVLRTRADPGNGPAEGVDPVTVRSSESPRRRLLGRWHRSVDHTPPSRSRAATDAEGAWRLLAGPTDVDDALCQMDRVEAASRLSSRLGALAAVSQGLTDVPAGTPRTAELVMAACALVPMRGLAAGPHVVRVPGPADAELASFLLDSLAALSVERQIVAVTSDDAVIEWAELESHARRARLVRAG